MKINAVLVGIGGFGIYHLKEALEGKSKDLLNIVGVVDPYPEFCSKIDDVKARNIPIYATLEEFYNEHTADLAVISTPTAFHANQIIYCMNHGANVLCEKPLCGDEKDIERIQRAEKENGKFLLVGYQWSTSKAVLDAKKDIIKGIYGNLKSVKTVVMWPRDDKYFNRSTGWAGKKYGKDGAVIFDSIANNAAAHFLHNMFFLIGPEVGLSEMPVSINGELTRANKIENFDSCVISVTFKNGAEGYFIASHTTNNGCGPYFVFEFENGRVVNEGGHFIGKFNDGRVIDYGAPDDASNCYKLEVAARLTMGETLEYCGSEGASVHTKVINYIQNNCEIHDFTKTHVENGITVVDGLFETLNEIYKNPEQGKLLEFVKENG